MRPAHTLEAGPRFRRTSEPAESAGARSRASAAPEIGNPLTGSHFSGAARLPRLARRVLWQSTAGERIDPNSKPEKRQKNLDKAMKNLLKNYPPPAKK